MLLDQLFDNIPETEMVIIRKNGVLKHISRPVPKTQTPDNVTEPTPLFPAYKDS